MANPINLVITGKPSPRTAHPASAGRRRTPMNEYKARNQSSSVFGGNEDQNRFKKRPASEKKSNQASVGVITKGELQAIKDLTAREGNGQKYYAVRNSPRKAAPAGVPQLSLDAVVGKEEDEDMSYAKLPTKPPQLQSPTSKDTYSWGTPAPIIQKKLSIQTPKGGGWQVNQGRKPKKQEPSARQRDDVPSLDLKLSQTNEGLAQLRQAAKQVNEDVRIEYLGALNQKKIEDLRKLGQNYKANFVDNTLLADQLGQVRLNEERPPSTAPPIGVHQKFDSRMRRHQDMHSSPIDQAPSEVNLSKRFQFGARILSLDGHDARRELNGFFFIADQTLTVYEFRQFGTRSNALPFIQKGNYNHVSGYRIGKPYTILDINAGKDISFSTDNQPSLPDSLRQKNLVILRITEVDEANKKTLLYDNCKTTQQRSKVEKYIHDYHLEEKQAVCKVLVNVRTTVRQKLKMRGAKTMTNLHNHFKEIDRSGDGLLDKNELKKALKHFRIDIDESMFESVWNVLDRNKDGNLDYGEFVRGFCGEMTEERKKWIRKAFTRLDPKRSGVANLVDLQKFFCTSRHPDVVNGAASESQVLEDMINVFQTTRQKKEIQYSEFEAYYEGVSMGVDMDEDFITLIRSSWTI